ncbi:MAG: hypothetical protein AB8G26_03325 [Ilumatobacter sp.]
MAFDESDRRRTFVLALLTVVAVPVLILAARPDEVETTTAPVASVAANRPPIDFVQDDPVFLDGPVVVEDNDPAAIAVPQRPAQESVRLEASFRSSVAGARSCLVRDFEIGVTVRVENLDNGRSITCVTAIAPLNQTVDVVVQTATFSRLADLTEAPITIELTPT